MVARSITADSPQVMRQLNTAVVLEAIRGHGPISRPGLARRTGLSMPTVTRIVHGLLSEGYLDEAAESTNDDVPRRPGPRAKLLSFRAASGYLLGIDTGADNSVAKLADLSGVVHAESRIQHRQPARADGVLADIRKVTQNVLDEAGILSSDLLAIAVGTPGVVDPNSGTISLAPQILGWEGLNIAAELADIADCPIVVENESHMSLLAEQWIGRARGMKDVVLVQLGIGIGGAILIGGQIYRGSSGAAGEVAYLVTSDATDDLPADSPTGALEWFAGGEAYRRHGARAAETPEGALLLELAGGTPDAVSAKIVFAAAELGDKTARAIISLLLGRLGRGLANIATILNPQLILLGGGITNAGEAVLEPLRDVIQLATPHPPEVALSSLGSDGSAIGAVRRALAVVEETIFSFIAPEPPDTHT